MLHALPFWLKLKLEGLLSQPWPALKTLWQLHLVGAGGKGEA